MQNIAKIVSKNFRIRRQCLIWFFVGANDGEINLQKNIELELLHEITNYVIAQVS